MEPTGFLKTSTTTKIIKVALETLLSIIFKTMLKLSAPKLPNLTRINYKLICGIPIFLFPFVMDYFQYFCLCFRYQRLCWSWALHLWRFVACSSWSVSGWLWCCLDAQDHRSMLNILKLIVTLRGGVREVLKEKKRRRDPNETVFNTLKYPYDKYTLPKPPQKQQRFPK